MEQQNTQQLTIDMSGRRGLAPRFWGDPDRDDGAPQPNLRYLADDGQTVGGIYNPFRRYGYLSAANATFTDVSDGNTPLVAAPMYVAHDTLNDDVIIADHGRIFNALQSGLDDVSLYSGAILGDLGSSGTPRIFDLDFYTINGARKLFVVHEKAGNIEIAYYDMPYDSDAGTAAFFSTQGGSGIGITNTLFMRVSDNGFAYVFSDSNVHKIDGTPAGGGSGTVTPNVLQFPTTFTISDAIDYRGFLFIGLVQAPVDPVAIASQFAVYNLQCGVYVWDRQSTVSGTTDYIPLYGARSIIKLYTTWTGVLRAMTVNAEGVLEIREYDGNSFNVISEVGRYAHPNCHDGVTTMNGLTIWLGHDLKIYAHGSIAPGEKDGLYCIGVLPDDSAELSGFVFLSGANNYSATTGFKEFRSGLLVGYMDHANAPTVKQWDMYGTGASSDGGNPTQCLVGNVFTAPHFLPQMSTVRHIDIYMAPGSGSGTSSAGSFNIYLNQSSAAWAQKNVTRNQHARGYIRLEVNKPYVNAIQIETLFPTGTSVSGNFDIAPSFAIVEYVPGEVSGAGPNAGA